MLSFSKKAETFLFCAFIVIHSSNQTLENENLLTAGKHERSSNLLYEKQHNGEKVSDFSHFVLKGNFSIQKQKKT